MSTTDGHEGRSVLFGGRELHGNGEQRGLTLSHKKSGAIPGDGQQSLFGTGERGIFRRTLPVEEKQGRSLKKTVGVVQLTMIGVGAMIGAGIFALAGPVARDVAGPGVVISFALAGIASLCAAFAYAEFAGMVPRAGSSYTYCSAVLGEGVGWVIGWDILLEYTAIVATVAIAISGYMNFLLASFGLALPTWASGAFGTGDGHVINILAMVICLAVAALLNAGTRSSVRAETTLTIIKIAVVVLIIFVGVFFVDPTNITDDFLPYGLGSAATGAAMVFFAVFGYDAMSTAAEEAVEGPRHLPKAMLWTLGISMTLYFAVCLVLVGMVHYSDIDAEAGLSAAFQSVGLGWVANLIAIGAIIGVVTVCFSFMLGASRVWYALSRDGLMPKYFGHLSKRRVPNRATWIIGGGAAVLAGLLPVEEAAELTNIGILFAFVIVIAAVGVLRLRQPNLPRTFRTPALPLVVVVGIGFCVWLMFSLNGLTWARFAIWLVIGAIIYAFYGYRNARRINPGGSKSLEELPNS